MSLTIIGLGLHNEKDITVKGLQAVKYADKIYLESYTNLLHVSKEELEKAYGQEVIIADRELVEKKAEETILNDAKTQQVCFLVIGDVFAATTHTDLYTRAKELGIPLRVVNNASVLTAIGATGLQVYKFGKVTSIPFDNDNVSTPYQYLEQNKSIGAHTLFLLDLDPIAKKYLSIKDAIEYLLKQEENKKKGLFSKDTTCIGCARLGSPLQSIKYGTAEQLLKEDFGSAPYCFIVPENMHFMEEEFVEQFGV